MYSLLSLFLQMAIAEAWWDDRMNPLPAAFKQLHMVVAQQKADAGGSSNGEVYWRYSNLAKGMFTLSHQSAHARAQDSGTGLALRLWGRRCFHLMRNLAQNIAAGKRVIVRLQDSTKNRELVHLGLVLREWQRRGIDIAHQRYVVNGSLNRMEKRDTSRSLQQWQAYIERRRRERGRVTAALARWKSLQKASSFLTWRELTTREMEDRQKARGAVLHMLQR